MKQRLLLNKWACVRGLAIKMKDLLLDCREDIYEDALQWNAHYIALNSMYIQMRDEQC